MASLSYTFLSSVHRIKLQVLLIASAGLVWLVYGIITQLPTLIWQTTTLGVQDAMAYKKQVYVRRSFAKSNLVQDFYIGNNGQDILVNLRIQKTSSTSFNSHLWYELDFNDTCSCRVKKCTCLRRIRNKVLFSSEEDKWPCGVHPDWTVLHACMRDKIDKRLGINTSRRFLLLTMVREPVNRFVSEWLHMQRGAGWEKSPHICNGRAATEDELPPCYTDLRKADISLKEFYSCPDSLAINRQMKMLANLSIVNCYNTSGMTTEERNIQILRSAKDNLKNMAFFGITEYQELSQRLFERTFHLKFTTDFQKRDVIRASQIVLSPTAREKIIKLNKYDIQLYQFAKDLFFQRINRL